MSVWMLLSVICDGFVCLVAWLRALLSVHCIGGSQCAAVVQEGHGADAPTSAVVDGRDDLPDSRGVALGGILADICLRCPVVTKVTVVLPHLTVSGFVLSVGSSFCWCF